MFSCAHFSLASHAWYHLRNRHSNDIANTQNQGIPRMNQVTCIKILTERLMLHGPNRGASGLSTCAPVQPFFRFCSYRICFLKCLKSLSYAASNTGYSHDAQPLRNSATRRLRGGLRTDGFMVGSFSDHGRIGRALEMTFHPFSANFFEILDGHFSWQAQYLVSLGYDTCCSALCK